MATAATAPAKRRARRNSAPRAVKHRATKPARETKHGAIKPARQAKRGSTKPAREAALGATKPPREARQALKRVAKSSHGVRAAKRALPGKAGNLWTMWRLARLGRRAVKRQLPAAADSLGEMVALAREEGVSELAKQIRRVPVQRSIDVAVPLEVAFDEWMRLDALPEGDHRVEDIERVGRGRLRGRVNRLGASQDWEAEVKDQRRDESFAWRSVCGSDVAGLITFHRLGARLTRLELELDIVPTGMSEALAFALRLSDRWTEAELRRFKARVETISPDAYPARVKRSNGTAPKRGARSSKPRKQTKEE